MLLFEHLTLLDFVCKEKKSPKLLITFRNIVGNKNIYVVAVFKPHIQVVLVLSELFYLAGHEKYLTGS